MLADTAPVLGIAICRDPVAPYSYSYTSIHK